MYKRQAPNHPGKNGLTATAIAPITKPVITDSKTDWVQAIPARFGFCAPIAFEVQAITPIPIADRGVIDSQDAVVVKPTAADACIYKNFEMAGWRPIAFISGATQFVGSDPPGLSVMALSIASYIGYFTHHSELTGKFIAVAFILVFMFIHIRSVERCV